MKKIYATIFICSAIFFARSASAAVVYDSITGAGGGNVASFSGTDWLSQSFEITSTQRITQIEIQFYCETQSAAGTAEMSIYRSDGSLVKHFSDFSVPRSDVGQITTISTTTVLTADVYRLGFRKVSGSCNFGIREESTPDDAGRYDQYSGSGSFSLGSGTDIRIRLTGEDAYPSTITPAIADNSTSTTGILDLGGVYQFSDTTKDYAWIVAHVQATSTPIGQFVNEYFAPISRLDEFATSTFSIDPSAYPDGDYWVGYQFADSQRNKFGEVYVLRNFHVADADGSNATITIPPDGAIAGITFSTATTSSGQWICDEGALYQQWYCALKMGIVESYNYLFGFGPGSEEAVNSIWGMIKTTFPISWFYETITIVRTAPPDTEQDIELTIPYNGTSTQIFSLNYAREFIPDEAETLWRTIMKYMIWLSLAGWLFWRFAVKVDQT